MFTILDWTDIETDCDEAQARARSGETCVSSKTKRT